MMFRVALKLLCLCLMFWLTACAAAVVSGTARGGYDPQRGVTDTSGIASDASITSAINASYVRDDLISAFDVKVKTYRGTVTLYGSVASREAAGRAVELARSVAGVSRVVSRLVVVER